MPTSHREDSQSTMSCPQHPIEPPGRARVDAGRRRWLGRCSRLLLQGAPLAAGLLCTGARATDTGFDEEVVKPAIGDRVNWPVVRLLDGRQLQPPGVGQEATVLVFFDTTCPFCARHNVHLQKLFDTTRGLPLRVLGAAHETRVDRVQTYRQRRGLTFDVSLDHEPLHAALSRRKGVPLTCVVDRQQRLRAVIRGEMAEDDVLELARWARA